MSKLVLLGNSPSSGSTMFADLLDSSDMTACGPELEYFCNPLLFDFASHQHNIEKTGSLFALRSTGIFPNWNRLHHYGLTKQALIDMILSSKDYPSFEESFCRHFLSFRSKNETGVVFEKTPQNLNTVGQFLTQSQGHFVCLVRHPLYVFNSLLNRGWEPYSALATWLIYASKAVDFLEHDRFHVVKLEELVGSPFSVTASVMNTVLESDSITPDELKQSFEHNTYRENASEKLPSWSVNQSVKEIKNPNLKEVSTDRVAMFANALDLRVSQEYAHHYGLSRITYREAMEKFGYASNEFDSGRLKQIPALTMNERFRYLKKAARSTITGHGKISDYALYTKALV